MITVPYVVRGLVRFKRPETLLITSVGLCFAFAMIAERLGCTVVLGAFLAGLFVAESEQGAVVEKLIEPVRHIFGAIFFVGVGILIEPQLLARSWLALAALTVVAIVGKTVFVSLASLLIGERPDTAVKPDLQSRMAARSQSFFALAARGDAEGGLLYSLAVALKAVTSVPCPLLVRASIPALDWIDRHLPVRVHNALHITGHGWTAIASSVKPRSIDGGKVGQRRQRWASGCVLYWGRFYAANEAGRQWPNRKLRTRPGSGKSRASSLKSASNFARLRLRRE